MKLNQLKIPQAMLVDHRGSVNEVAKFISHSKIVIRRSSINSCLSPKITRPAAPPATQTKAKKLKLRLSCKIGPSGNKNDAARPVLFLKSRPSVSKAAPQGEKKTYVSNLIKDIIKGGVLSLPSRSSSKGTPVPSPRNSLAGIVSPFGNRKKSYVSAKPLFMSHRSPSLSGDAIKIVDSEKLAKFHSRKNSADNTSAKKAKISIKSSLNSPTGSTGEGSNASGSFAKFNDPISQERDQLVSFNKACMVSQLIIYHYRLSEE